MKYIISSGTGTYYQFKDDWFTIKGIYSSIKEGAKDVINTTKEISKGLDNILKDLNK